MYLHFYLLTQDVFYLSKPVAVTDCADANSRFLGLVSVDKTDTVVF